MKIGHLIFVLCLFSATVKADLALQEGKFTVFSGSQGGPTQELFTYLHAACFQPPYRTKTDCVSIDKNSFSIPGLSMFFRYSNSSEEKKFYIKFRNNSGFAHIDTNVVFEGDVASILMSLLVFGGAPNNLYPRHGVRGDVWAKHVFCSANFEISDKCSWRGFNFAESTFNDK